MTSYPAPPVLDPRTHCRTLRPDELRPGSPEAVAAGCACDPRRNRGGQGEGPSWCNTFQIDAGCALHQQLRPIVREPAPTPDAPPRKPRARPPRVHYCGRCGGALPRGPGRPPKVGDCCLTETERRYRASQRDFARQKATKPKAVTT